MKSNRLIITVTALIFLGFFTAQMNSQRISSTKHNMSTSGPGTVKASTESEICIFCHTPHSSKPRTPLWNRDDPGTTYTLYSSSTTNATIGQPDGSSVMCLSCHDGTIALGKVQSRTTNISFGSVTTMPTGNSNLTSDLSNDHPISFTYNSTLATTDGELITPASITGVTLENSKVQCRTCHDPHYTSNSAFLIVSNQASALCVSCHSKANWTSSTHYSSTRTWNGSGTNPWHTSYSTVANNGCESCHNPHNAAKPTRLLNQATTEEANCYSCHNATVATNVNIYTQFQRTYRHNIATYTDVHTPNESNIPSTQHVECVDCHNPHQSNNSTASAPNRAGSLTGVKGVNASNSSVSSVSYEYEVCFRCHSSSTWVSSPTTRQIVQTDTRLEFASGNPSYHAVVVQGTNADVPTLYGNWTTTSRLYCSDCHASAESSTTAQKGPHGSIYNHILKKQNVTTDPTTESAANYALCYSCHDRNYFITEANSNNSGFRFHFKHVTEERTPCNTCHDPHGISSTQGNATNNSKLINFNTNVVTANGGVLRFARTGYRAGNCTLRCHSENHNAWSY